MTNLFPIVLIPRLSYVGASWALFITEVVIFLTMFSLISRYFFRLHLLEIFLKVAVAGCATYFLLLYLRELNLFLLISGSAVVFVLVLFFIGYVSKEHIQEIRRGVFQIS